jgi:hypothetical protein
MDYSQYIVIEPQDETVDLFSTETSATPYCPFDKTYHRKHKGKTCPTEGVLGRLLTIYVMTKMLFSLH